VGSRATSSDLMRTLGQAVTDRIVLGKALRQWAGRSGSLTRANRAPQITNCRAPGASERDPTQTNARRCVAQDRRPARRAQAAR
jgi:hypothetical protein